MGEIVEVDEKGRILIPISIRNTLGIEKGVKLVLEIRGSEIVITRIEIQPAKQDPEALKGFLQNIPKI
jgi:AbrB family looped-hinge helix DNA binding protein